MKINWEAEEEFQNINYDKRELSWKLCKESKYVLKYWTEDCQLKRLKQRFDLLPSSGYFIYIYLLAVDKRKNKNENILSVWFQNLRSLKDYLLQRFQPHAVLKLHQHTLSTTWSVRERKGYGSKVPPLVQPQGYNFICSIFWVSNWISLEERISLLKRKSDGERPHPVSCPLLYKRICHCFLMSHKRLVA